MHCINVSHPDFIVLKNESTIPLQILKAKVSVWMDQNSTADRFPTAEELNLKAGSVNQMPRIIDAFDKIQRNIFTENKLQGWINDLQKLGVSAQQIELFKEVAQENMTKDQILAAIAANYSYTIEINTAQDFQKIPLGVVTSDDGTFEVIHDSYADTIQSGFKTKEEARIFINNYKSRNSQYYSNLTVPGGTNYTENEIATPQITPSIKGHGQFSTDQGIGWFRSDETNPYSNTLGLDVDAMTEEEYDNYLKNYPKVRRILEVQSDLFQKGRNLQNLDDFEGSPYEYAGIKDDKHVVYSNYKIAGSFDSETEAKEFADKANKGIENPKNQFLQLLNKDNNWVTFFVKSIIQDSAKKGYEKVLFPSGNTASKIEGHTTLEEFKEQKEKRIAQLEKEKNKYIEEKKPFIGKTLPMSESIPEAIRKLNEKVFTQENFNNGINNYQKEINQLKQELKRIEGPEGMGALKPIYNFYENTVANILRKQYGKGNVKEITDEHGNTWFEVSTAAQPASSTILYNKPKLNTYQKQAADIFWDYVYNKKLSDRDINAINKALKQISDQIGDVEWSLRLSKNNTYYIAGYKNASVTMEDYYSPHANGMFRQIESSTTEGPIENLNKKLHAWAKTHGISIQAMESLIERFEGRYNNTALGVADFANALIGLAENQKVDTLPEEVAHFAIEIMLSDPSIQRALETVTTTEMYAKVKEDYADVYTNEIDFRKEALGKLLAQEILATYNNQERQEPKGFFAYLRAAAEKFLGWIQSFMNKRSSARVELDNVIKPLAAAILDNKFMGKFGEINTSQTEKLYQLPQDEETPEPVAVEDPIIKNKKKFLEEVVLQLSDRMGLLKRSARSNVTIANLESEINRLEHMLAKGELDLAISGFISLATSEISILDKNLKKMRETKDINPTTLVMSENFMQMYENIFANFIETMNDFDIPLEETEEFRKMIHNLAVQISETRGINTILLKKVTRETLDKANTDEYGNKIDPTFDPGLIAEETHEDVSTWRFLVGNYKYADSKIIKAAHKIIFNAIGNVRRYATQKANNLLEAQDLMFRAGGKIEDLIELNEEGKPTHYFIREYQWGKYYAEMDKTKQAIVEALGVERYEDVKREFLTKEQLTEMGKLWKAFFKENTVKRQVKLEDGTVMDTTLPNDSYRNPRFDEVMKNPATREFYERLIRLKRESIEKLPVQYRTERMVYMVPPILKSTIDRLTNKEENFFARIAKLGREALFVENDETQFGQLNVLNNKMVPIHFTRPLNDIKDLSYDITRSVTLFAEMAENFKEMNKIAGELGSLQYTLAERNYFTDKKHTRRKKGIETTEYQALELLLDTHVFGIEREAKSFTVPKNSMTEKLGIADKQFSWTKASQRFAKFIRNNNLAFNFITSISAWLKGSGDSIIEDQIGVYTTNESKNWARVEFDKNLFHVLGELGKARQTNKMHLILQEADIIDLEKTLYETNKNRAARRILNQDVMYTTFASGDYGIKGRITLAIYDNYRLYNGQFMTRAKFYEKTAAEQKVPNDKKHQKAVSKQWKALQEKSLYNAYDVVDGQLKVKPEFEQYVTPGVLNSARGKIEQVTTTVDGTMSKTDKGKLARTWLGDFVLMHRGWFIGMVDTRFRREGTNMMTEEEEIGTYRATAGFLYNAFYKTLVKDKAGLQAAFGTWNTLSPAKKRGVMKTALDFLYLNIAAFVAGLANVAADDADDDDFTAQYLAYQLNRVLLEQGAAWSPAELINMIDEPVVGARMIKDLADMTEAFNFGEVYESGMYEGKSHARKWWMKKLPTRNIYEMQFPDLKNQFIKTMVDSRYYEWMTPEQGHSVAKKGGFWDWLLPSGLGSDEDTRAENVEIIYQDLQEETEEDNGLN